MIEVLAESAGNIFGIRASGKVTADDYEQVLIPRLKEVIEAHGKARVLYYMADDMEGFELGAMWDDAKFGLGHRDEFEKIAVVGGPQWVQWGAQVGAHFMKGVLRVFPGDQLQEAWEWVRA
ncbi:STAS/SEC14 domain-containing protein [Thermodesulfobacteriota bacterium]